MNLSIHCAARIPMQWINHKDRTKPIYLSYLTNDSSTQIENMTHHFKMLSWLKDKLNDTPHIPPCSDGHQLNIE